MLGSFFHVLAGLEMKLAIKLEDMHVDFYPLMFAWVTMLFNIISLGATTHSITTSRFPMNLG
jgi:hypothetical protein